MKNYLVVFLTFLVVDVIILYKLFFPSPHVIITPEFGGGDTNVIHFPERKIMCESVKKFSIPFWAKNIALGYPLYAVNENGFFNPIFIVGCLFFNYPLAFNFALFLHILLFQTGIIMLSKKIKIHLGSAIFGAIFVPFIPLYIMNFMNITLWYPISFFPFILAYVIDFLHKSSLLSELKIILFVSLQFLTGHTQVFFICWFSLIVFLAGWFFINKKVQLKTFAKVIFLYFISLCLAGFQTLPFLEFFFHSNRKIGSSLAILYDQNFTLNYLKTLVNPLFFGDVTRGTYDLTTKTHPWESNLFIYYTPLVFVIISIISFFIQNKYKKCILICFFILITFLLLALGKNSPIFFIHAFPLFGSFRFPTRYLLIFVFFLGMLSMIGLSIVLKSIKVKKLKYIIILFAICLVTYEITHYFNFFHIFYPVKNLYKKNKITDYLTRRQTPRLYVNIMQTYPHDYVYLAQGYKNNFPSLYTYTNDALLGNIPSIYNIQTLNIKKGPILNRYFLLYQYLNNQEIKNNNLSFKKDLYNLLNISGIDYILSPLPIKEKKYQLITFITNPIHTIYLYKNNKSYGRISLFDNVQLIQYAQDFYEKIVEDIQQSVVFVEDSKLTKLFLDTKKSNLNYSYNIINDNSHYVKFIVNTSKPALMVFNDAYYPGWSVLVNGKKKEIYKANVYFRGVYLEKKGKHTVEFIYIPYSFYIGLLISGSTIFCYIFFNKSRLNNVFLSRSMYK